MADGLCKHQHVLAASEGFHWRAFPIPVKRRFPNTVINARSIIQDNGQATTGGHSAAAWRSDSMLNVLLWRSDAY